MDTGPSASSQRWPPRRAGDRKRARRSGARRVGTDEGAGHRHVGALVSHDRTVAFGTRCILTEVLRRQSVMTLLAVTIVASACTTGNEGSSPSSTANTQVLPDSGTSSRGVVSGVLVMVGGRVSSPPSPVEGAVEAFTTENFSDAPVASVTTDDAGRYRLSLPPGRFYLRGHSPWFVSGQMPCNARDAVDIVDGVAVEADVHCDRH